MKNQKLSRWPWIVVGVMALYVLASFLKPAHDTSMAIEDFAALPVLNGGRIKPIDTVARVSLLMLHGKQTLKTPTRKLSATEWLMDMLFRQQQANTYACLRVDNPDVLGLLHLEQRRPPLYTFAEMGPALAAIETQAGQAEEVKAELRTPYQRAIVQLQTNLILYQKLQNTARPADMDRFADFVSAPHSDEAHQREHLHFMAHVAEFACVPERAPEGVKWTSVGESLLTHLGNTANARGALAFARMGDALRQFDPVEFNAALTQQQEWLRQTAPGEARLAKKELLFNRVQPFMKSLVIYLLAALLVFGSWLRRSSNWARGAMGLVGLALVVHTVGLLTRMILQGRPPVTNLYSSAIFIGWASVVMGLVLERIHRNTMGVLVASTIGFLTMIVAHNLASSGDTMEMMRAVLDTNFWLATHVVCVTIGYSATFLAGFLAIVGIVRSALQKDWPALDQQKLQTMVFGVLCFATFFSFLGTILGGIWADQSWGRFWGWDPKENGALLIVLWNAFALHARKLGATRGQKFLMLAVAGNIVTSFSWFGVNMLGVGLHSYGFMEKAFVWLLAFVVSQVAVIAVAVKQDYFSRTN